MPLLGCHFGSRFPQQWHNDVFDSHPPTQLGEVWVEDECADGCWVSGYAIGLAALFQVRTSSHRQAAAPTETTGASCGVGGWTILHSSVAMGTTGIKPVVFFEERNSKHTVCAHH